MDAFEREARALPGIHWQLGTRVAELITEAGRVVGLDLQRDGTRETLSARAVVMATGGFASDQESVRRALGDGPALPRVLLGGGQGATGAGHRMLIRAGAAMVNLDAVWMYPYATPDPDDPAGERGLAVRGLTGDVWVNRDGERFHDESRRGGASGTSALLAQPGATAWAIIDASIAASLTVAAPGYRVGTRPDRAAIDRLLTSSPHIHRHEDLARLGELAGIDSSRLATTIAAHNDARRLGHDAEFHRSVVGLRPLDQPPFTAIRLLPMARKTLGGVRTDLDTRVLRPDGTAIDGLFAAGEVAGMAGGHINGTAALEGTMVGPSLFSGRIAGEAVAA